MKKFAIGLLATTVLALAAPAVAQDRGGYGGGYGGGYSGGGYGGGGSYGGGYGYGYSQNWERGGRVGFSEEFNHVYAGIQHGLRDGSYTQWEARQFIREVEGLRRLERLYRANDGRLNGWIVTFLPFGIRLSTYRRGTTSRVRSSDPMRPASMP